MLFEKDSCKNVKYEDAWNCSTSFLLFHYALLVVEFAINIRSNIEILESVYRSCFLIVEWRLHIKGIRYVRNCNYSGFVGIITVPLFLLRFSYQIAKCQNGAACMISVIIGEFVRWWGSFGLLCKHYIVYPNTISKLKIFLEK